MMRRRRRLPMMIAGAVVLSTALASCNGVADLPLPGGAATGSDAYHVTVEFADVLDLVPQSAVKVNDVTVGAVDAIALDGWHARVTIRLQRSVRLPDNAVARLRQTSLLGEKFVALSPPDDQAARGRLGEGDVIPLSRSGRNPEIEEVLGTLSLILNGGGVAQLKTINVELARAMRGHESDIKGAISSLDTFIGSLDQHKSEVVRAIDGLDRLSARLEAQKGEIAAAIDDLGPGLKVLADQRRALTRMLTALSDLGEVGTRVINASRADTLANLRSLAPIMAKLVEAGDNLPGALEMLVTYPFPQAAVGAVKGDYTNLRITADLDVRNILRNIGGPDVPIPDLPIPTLPTGLPTGTGVPTGLPTCVPLVDPGCPTPGVGGGGLGGGGPKVSVTPPSLPTIPPAPTPPVGGGGRGGGGVCLPVTCIGAGARTSIDEPLALLLLGGLA